MTNHWVTIASPTREAMVNPLLAACDAGYVPEAVTVVSNPSAANSVEAILPFYEDVFDAYDVDGATSVREVSDETAYDELADTYREVVDVPAGDSVAVDITPGRKFMSAIAFQAGLLEGVDHVYYLLLASDAHYGRLYQNIPRTAVDLVDFTEVI